ncbi:MAG: hypothetical protein M3389_14270, partial [Actinomycetota bacterium]|nr:hypothetical protein [Actinomycetota bacterium]
VRLGVTAPRRGLRELVLRELLYERGDGTCCPTFVRTQRFRWDGDRMARVPGSVRTRHAGD